MKVISYSRLGNLAGIDLAETDYTGWQCGQAYSDYDVEARGLEGPTLFLFPIGTDPKVTLIKDPFMQMSAGKVGSVNQNNLVHYKLPELWFGNNTGAKLTNAAHKSGVPDKWHVTLGEKRLLKVPPHEHSWSSDAFWWKQTYDEDGDVLVTRVTCAWIFWTDTFWWVEDNPVLYETFIVHEVRVNPANHRIEVRSTQEFNRNYGPVSGSAVDDGLVRFDIYNWFKDLEERHLVHWSSWEFQGYLNYWISANRDELPSISDLFDEITLFNGGMSGRNTLDMQWLIEHAFMDACDDIGKMNDNMLANLVEIAKFVINVASGNALRNLKDIDFDLEDIPELIKNGLPSYWLGYRYAYTTTRYDIQDFSNWLLKKTDQYFDFLNKNFYQISYGVASRKVDGVTVQCRCKISWRPRALDGLHTAVKYLHDTGLELNPYVLWDMIPFSFIADWFVPIGDVLSVKSDAKYYTDQYYDFQSCCFSVKYNMQGVDDSVGTRYYRWYQGPPYVEGYTWFDEGDKKVSPKTIVKRFLDGGSLAYGLKK